MKEHLKDKFACGGPILACKHLSPLPPDRWTPVIQWQGVTLQVLTFRITPQPGRASIRWRRWGGSMVPYRSGRLDGPTEFHVYPGELFLSVDLRTDERESAVDIEAIEE